MHVILLYCGLGASDRKRIPVVFNQNRINLQVSKSLLLQDCSFKPLTFALQQKELFYFIAFLEHLIIKSGTYMGTVEWTIYALHVAALTISIYWFYVLPPPTTLPPSPTFVSHIIKVALLHYKCKPDFILILHTKFIFERKLRVNYI